MAKALSKQAKQIEKHVEGLYNNALSDKKLAEEYVNRHCGMRDLARAEGVVEAYEKVLGYLEALTYEPVKQ